MNLISKNRLLSFGALSQAAFWTVLLIFIFSYSVLVLDWQNAFTRALLILVCHLANFYCFFSYIIPTYFEKKKFFHVTVASIIVLLVLTPLRVYTESLYTITETVNVKVGSNVGIGFVIFTEVAIASFASLLRLAVSREQMQQQLSDLAKSQLETELKFLKGQMSPHFLFNSINNIYSLVLLKSDQAPDALMKLSGLLRYLLYESEHKVLISKEVESLKIYADLFQLKFRDPLKIKWLIELEDPNRHIEPLMLIPLLENSIKHSGLGTDPDSEAIFSIQSVGEKLIVKTENSISKKNVPIESGGIGLVNIQKRLEKIFPNRFTLNVQKSDTHFSLTLEMPLL